MRIAITVGSTRPGRNADVVAKWVHSHAVQRTDATFELVDIADFKLPVLDEPFPPSMGRYTQPHTQAWAAKIDGFVFVTPEYNHSMSGALKNAIDFLKNEWHNKAAGFVSYGAVGGTRAVEHLGLVMGEFGAHGVTADVIAPGLTNTKTMHGVSEALYEYLPTQQAIPRVIEPSDLVGVVSFLCSPDCGFATGQTIAADGGQVRI